MTLIAVTSEELGKANYEGYFKRCEGKSLISGAPLPTWENQSEEIQDAWCEGASAVLDLWNERT
jgi:hypothetical protein